MLLRLQEQLTQPPFDLGPILSLMNTARLKKGGYAMQRKGLIFVMGGNAFPPASQR
jgi:hypothetical protein